MSRPAIRIENLGKRYIVDHERNARGGYRTLRESLVEMAQAPLRRLRGEGGMAHEEFWALKDASFDVQPGEVVGIIGRNGAGKSTLLKILSQITKPTTGRVEINGRVGSLLEVGTGFHPELTGRENIYLNGSILGMRKAEIDRKFDEIVDFSGVEQFLDTPVKRFSSGMYVRLAFAVAAHLEPEILIVDEVLAVGDAEFQKKCFQKLRFVSELGCTILLVSHNMAAIDNMCTRAVTLDHGLIVGKGLPKDEIARYMSRSSSCVQASVDLAFHPSRQPKATSILRSLDISSGGIPTAVVSMGGDIAITIGYEVPVSPLDLRLGIVIHDQIGSPLIAFSPTFQSPDLLSGAARSGRATVEIPWLNLSEGIYSIHLHAHVDGHVDHIENACLIEVIGADVFETGRVLSKSVAPTFLPASWSLTP